MINVQITENTAAALTAAVKGELDTAAVETFKAAIAPVMQDAQKQITLDFSELEFISSAGLRALLLVNKEAAAKGGSVTITGMRPEIKQIFQLTGFDSMFAIA